MRLRAETSALLGLGGGTMGLTKNSTGRGAVDSFLETEENLFDIRVVLAGNPNVGKSTVFNSLTGMHQHTGNWPGKTVTGASGTYTYQNKTVSVIDLPGCYSLTAQSAEEEVSRDFVCFGDYDAVVVICDATCLERNLILVLQMLEITANVIVCVNLMDEADKKKISVHASQLECLLGVPVVCTAIKRKGIRNYGYAELKTRIMEVAHQSPRCITPVRYGEELETAICSLTESLSGVCKKKVNPRWLALKILENDVDAIQKVETYLEEDVSETIQPVLQDVYHTLKGQGIEQKSVAERLVAKTVQRAEKIAHVAVKSEKTVCFGRDRKIDRVLMGKMGFPVMGLMFFIVLWLTIAGANYPSELLSRFFFQTEEWLSYAMQSIGIPDIFIEGFVFGIYRMVTRVVSVMLPPMAIFFPLFTLLEDAGYLPRVAFNLDKCFRKCNSSGKQALTMCMGFGCNAAGVVGARIIDSPRERLIAVLTNSFVPCNGKFPTLIALISIFLVTSAGTIGSIYSALVLFGVILFGIIMTFLVSKLLSMTVLRGVPSSFALELPPYRRPQIGRVLVRSIFDRTLFVLGRAVLVAAPAGLVVWLLANLTVGGETLLAICSSFLDPFGRAIGMDGVILTAFILGFPANETVVPIMLMAYLSGGTLVEMTDLNALKQIFQDNGWTMVTAINVMLFSLLHWPCSTTLITVKKETGSIKWTILVAAIPSLMGILICFLFTTITRLV